MIPYISDVKYRLAEGDRVKPLKTGEVYSRMVTNAQYLISLDPDRILARMRMGCGLSTHGKAPYGGWGGFHAHYLRAMCAIYRSMLGVNDEYAQRAREQGLYMLESLRELQLKTGQSEPVFGFLTPDVARSVRERGQLMPDSVYSHTNINAVFYGIHKNIIGGLEAYRTFGEELGLQFAKDMYGALYQELKQYPHEHLEKMMDSRRTSDLFTEIGGIQSAAWELYRATGDEFYRESADLFRRDWFEDMLLRDEDRLGENMEHANSEIPCVEGMADHYMLTGDGTYRRRVENFIRWNREGHQLANGGVSGRSAFPDYTSELYNYPKRTYFHIMDTDTKRIVTSGESCCSHNLNRICAKILSWDMEPVYGDEWEKRFINAVLPHQNPETGMFVYNLKLKTNAYKNWGLPTSSFWCCYGTGVEVYGSLTDGAFFYNDESVVANLYMPCELTLPERGLRITEETDYPNDPRVCFTIHTQTPQEFDLVLRIPGWLTEDACLTVNGQRLSAPEKGKMYHLKRVFADGDRVELELPFALRYERMPDRPEYVAVFYGPNLLVLCGDGGLHYVLGDAQHLLDHMEQVGKCIFTAKFHDHGDGEANFIYKPLRRVTDEVYCGYTHVAQPPKTVVTDCVSYGDSADMAAHGFKGVGERIDYQAEHTMLHTTYTHVSEHGQLWFTLKSHRDKEMLLRLYFDGSATAFIHKFAGHGVFPLFDIQIQKPDGSFQTVCTKSLENDFPGKIYYENFVLPRALTAGREELTIRLMARDFHDNLGAIERLADGLSLYYVDE